MTNNADFSNIKLMDIVYCIESKELLSTLPDSFQGIKKTPVHDWSHFLSRKALSGALETINIQVRPEDVKIERHLHIENNQELLASLSHTDGHGVGLVVQKGDFISVGIDIELRERKVKEGINKFYFNDHDSLELQADPLLLWSLKEAAFKALSPYIETLQEKTFVLKDLWINDSHFGLVSNPTKALGMVDYAYELRADDLLLISFALLANVID